MQKDLYLITCLMFQNFYYVTRETDEMPFPAWMMKVIKREMETQRESAAVMDQHSQTGILKGVDGCSQTNQVLVLCEMSDGQCVKKDSKKQPPIKTKKKIIDIE